MNDGMSPPPGQRAMVDLHCHTAASFDSLADPRSVVQAAAARGLTHVAITDHDGLDGALRARDLAPDGLTVIIGEECRTADGDLICIFLERAVRPGQPAAETIAEVRAQGGLVGVPHPFDGSRESIGKVAGGELLELLAASVDWIETHNARLLGGGNQRAAEFALAHGLPGVAASDAHSVLEVGVACSAMTGRPDTPAGLLAALQSAQLVPSRPSEVRRTFPSITTLIGRLRGNERIQPD